MGHDYVSFYFGPKSPMLYSIFKGNSDTDCSQSDVVYIMTAIPSLPEKKLNFVFTTGQAIMALSTQHNNVKDLDKIDWDIIFGKYWFDSHPQYTDRARKRMAELLVHSHVPVNCILSLVVMNKKMQDTVENMVYDAGLLIQVKQVPDYYYN
jgi:ssDNA thymidine ADP-ribosyltransferase, DarT